MRAHKSARQEQFQEKEKKLRLLNWLFSFRKFFPWKKNNFIWAELPVLATIHFTYIKITTDNDISANFGRTPSSLEELAVALVKENLEHAIRDFVSREDSWSGRGQFFSNLVFPPFTLNYCSELNRREPKTGPRFSNTEPNRRSESKSTIPIHNRWSSHSQIWQFCIVIAIAQWQLYIAIKNHGSLPWRTIISCFTLKWTNSLRRIAGCKLKLATKKISTRINNFCSNSWHRSETNYEVLFANGRTQLTIMTAKKFLAPSLNSNHLFTFEDFFN